MIDVNSEQQRNNKAKRTYSSDDNNIRSHSGSSRLAVSDTHTEMPGKQQIMILGRIDKRHATYLNRIFGRRDTTPRGFIGSTETYRTESKNELSIPMNSMPSILDHREVGDAEASFPIDTFEQLHWHASEQFASWCWN